MHLSKPRRGLGRWESLSRILPSSILLQAAPDIYLAVRQERQCKSNPPPINYLFHSPFSSLALSISPPSSVCPQSLFLPITPASPSLLSSLPGSPQRAASHCNINLAVRGAVAMWQTCHCNGQLDKCRGVAERCGPHTIPPPCYPQYIEERRAGDARRGKGKKESEKRTGEERRKREQRKGGGGGRDRESDFQRDNEPLNDG